MIVSICFSTAHFQNAPVYGELKRFGLSGDRLFHIFEDSHGDVCKDPRH